MDDALRTINYKNHTIDIFQDEDPYNPRDNDNICIFHIANKRYSFGDENYNSYDEIEAAEFEAKNNEDIILPLYMYDHSGITISLETFSCPWDSGQVGFISIPREKMLEEFGRKIFTKKLKTKGIEIAKAEVKELDQYIRGEVYGYVIDEDGDSCWGFYDEDNCVKEAKNVIDYIVKSELVKNSQEEKIST